MKQIICTERLESDPNCSSVSKQQKHWPYVFAYFLEYINLAELELVSLVILNVHNYIRRCAIRQSNTKPYVKQ